MKKNCSSHTGSFNQGINEGGQGGTIPRDQNHCGGSKSLRAMPKSPNNVTTTCFNTEHLLPKDLRFKHGGAKLAVPGTI